MNLTNRYYRAPGATAYIEVAIFPSNTWVGASRAYGRVFRPIVLTAADTILDLCGGMFVATEGVVYHALFAPQTRHIFERGGPVANPLPDDRVEIEGMPFHQYGQRHKSVTLPEETIRWPRFGAMDVLEVTG